MRSGRFRHAFVELMPDVLEPETLYISIEYTVAIHSCACGCGERVVTPLSPAEWRLTFDGETVSLWPSIGNWSFDCQSHYSIEGDRVIWDEPFAKEKIARVRARDSAALSDYYDGQGDADPEGEDAGFVCSPDTSRRTWRKCLRRWWRSRE